MPALMRDDDLLPVVLAPTVPAPDKAAADGTIVLELGHVRVRIEGQPNTAALVPVLDRVLR